MSSGAEIVHLYDDHYAVRDVAEAWVAAGRPPINSSWRPYREQLELRIGYEQGKPGYAPADDPRYPNLYPLGHVRAAALDIDATPARLRALTAAGLVRPFSWESWHWAAPNVYAYPLLDVLPANVASVDVRAFPDAVLSDGEEGDEYMRHMYVRDNGGQSDLWTLVNTATGEVVQTREQGVANTWAAAWGSARVMDVQSFLNALHAVQLTTDPDEQKHAELKKAIDDIAVQVAALEQDDEGEEPPKA